MRARRHAHLDRDLADLARRAPVGTLLVHGDALADDRALKLVEHHLRSGVAVGMALAVGIAGELLEHRRLDGLGGRLALELVLDLRGGVQRGAVGGANGVHQPTVHRGNDDLTLGLADLRGELALQCAQLLDLAMGDVEGVEDLGFGDLPGAGLDHQDRVLGPGDRKLEFADSDQVLLARVHYEVAVDLADPHGADGGRQGDVGDHQRGGGAIHREDVVGVDVVHRERHRDDLGLIAPALGEQRPDRPVDHARRQRALLARASLALEERAGNLPGGIHPLLDIDGEREKICVAEISGGRGRKDHRVALADHDGPACLLCDPSGLERDLAPGDLHGEPGDGVTAHVITFLSAFGGGACWSFSC